MIQRRKQNGTKIADKIIKKVEDKMAKRDKEMSGSIMFLEELIKAGKTPQAIVMAGEEESVSGTIGEDPETGEMYIEVELED